jgi:hypothetical protein
MLNLLCYCLLSLLKLLLDELVLEASTTADLLCTSMDDSSILSYVLLVDVSELCMLVEVLQVSGHRLSALLDETVTRISEVVLVLVLDSITDNWALFVG